MHTEIKHVGCTESITMKAVPIIGVAACDGSTERKYIEKLEELERSNQSNRLTKEQIELHPSRIMR